MKRFSPVAWLYSFAFVFFALPALGQATDIWQIGKLDSSDLEFKAPQSTHVIYQVGKSDWSHDWPAAEQVGAEYEILFQLDAPPRGVFNLTVSLLTGRLRVPDLQVSINGYKGNYYLRTQPIYNGTGSIGGVLKIELPTQYLKMGANTLVLSPVDLEEAAAGSSASDGTLRYDFIGLSNAAGAKYDRNAVSADLVPTMFYREKGGKLVELVDAYLRFHRKIPAGETVLAVNGASYKASIAPEDGFGEERLEFDVPEWQGSTTARLKVTAEGRHAFTVSLAPERKWTIFVVPHTHVDIGYTDYQGKVAEGQAHTLAEAARLIEEHPDFRFSTDGSWNLQQLMESRSKPERDEVLQLIRSDKMGLPADYFNLLTGYASLETLYRSLYYSKDMSREYGLPFDYATTTDVPSYTGAYPSVLASAGIHYWAVGANQDRAPVLMHEQWNEKSPFWWEGPDGQKVLFWYSWGYSQIWEYFTAEPTNAILRKSLPEFLAPYDRPDYKPDVAMMYGAQYENTALHPQLATFVTAWNHEYAYPKLEYATFADFFRYVDAHYGSELQTYKGDMGPYWEDGIGSDAYYGAEDRQNQSDALGAEIASTVSHVLDPNVHPPKAEFQDAWNNILLFAEHTWGAGNSISQPDSEEATQQLAVKDNFATQAHFEIADLGQRAVSQLARDIQVPGGTLIVFNPLGWTRDSLVQMDISNHERLVDLATHQEVPLEVMWEKENFRHVRFLARNLPAVGYKCYAVEQSTAQPQSGKMSKTPVIENQYYRIAVDPESGEIKSIFDKQLQKELVSASSPYSFGQYLYVTGGEGTRMIHPESALPAAQLTIHAAQNGECLGAEQTPWGYKLKLRTSGFNTPEIDLTILLFNDQKKIEFDYTVRKDYTTAKEGVYFAFPTSVDQPEFAYGIQQGWVDPAHGILKGGSLEWFSIQKWMAVHDAGMTVGIVPIDAPLASFGGINRGLWPGEFHPGSSTLFSYIMNNYWHTNYRAGQGGTFKFRYVLTSSREFDPAALSRLGWESMERPATEQIGANEKIGNPAAPLPATGASLLQIQNPNVALVTWKLAEDGEGTILRLKEIAGRSEEVAVTAPLATLRSASLCNSVEDNLRDLPVAANSIHLRFDPYQVLTVRLNFVPGSKEPESARGKQ